MKKRNLRFLRAVAAALALALGRVPRSRYAQRSLLDDD